MFGTDVDSFSETFLSFYKQLNMNYQILSNKEEQELLLDILKKIHMDSQVIGAPDREQVWHDGWEENLIDFRETKEKKSIVPKFIRSNQVIRLNGKFVKTDNSFFERDFAKLLQLFLYEKFLTEDITEVHEFGSGSGFNLVHLSEKRPDLKLFGSDFVQSSVTLLKELASHYNIDLTSRQFNMLSPDYDYKIGENSVVFTHGAIEQLASKYEAFIDFLIDKKPKLCFHIEPTVEVYNENDIFDYLQIMFHEKRGYSSGMIHFLKEKQILGKIKDLNMKRVFFGSKFMEGYTVTSWSPV